MSELVKWKWREFYLQRERATGKQHSGCGDDKAHKDEMRMLSKQSRGRCSICKGPIYRGDWIRWNKETKKARHAPYGYKAVDAAKPEA